MWDIFNTAYVSLFYFQKIVLCLRDKCLRSLLKQAPCLTQQGEFANVSEIKKKKIAEPHLSHRLRCSNVLRYTFKVDDLVRFFLTSRTLWLKSEHCLSTSLLPEMNWYSIFSPSPAFILCRWLNCSTNWMQKVFWTKNYHWFACFGQPFEIRFLFANQWNGWKPVWRHVKMQFCYYQKWPRSPIHNPLFFSLDVNNALPFSSTGRSFKNCHVSKITLSFRINRKSSNTLRRHFMTIHVRKKDR